MDQHLALFEPLEDKDYAKDRLFSADLFCTHFPYFFFAVLDVKDKGPQHLELCLWHYLGGSMKAQTAVWGYAKVDVFFERMAEQLLKNMLALTYSYLEPVLVLRSAQLAAAGTAASA